MIFSPANGMGINRREFLASIAAAPLLSMRVVAQDDAWAEVPAILDRIKAPVFPGRDFDITHYGAVCVPASAGMSPGAAGTSACATHLATIQSGGLVRPRSPSAGGRRFCIHSGRE